MTCDPDKSTARRVMDSAIGVIGDAIGDAISDAIGGLCGGLADLFATIAATIAKGYQWIAPLAFGIGCQMGCQTGEVAQTPEPAVVAVQPAPTAEPAPADNGPKNLGKFSITFYYVIGEDEVVAKRGSTAVVAANDNQLGSDAELAAVDPAPPVTLFTARCAPIADVSREFASQIELQGTGKLHDGRVLNIAGPCRCGHSPCFTETGSQWGTAGTGHALSPFRTVAVDPKVIKLGSLLYVPLLEGRMMPGREPWGGYVHDGCVVADDTGGGIEGAKLDLFVGRRAYYLGLGLSGSGGSHSWARHVDVFDGSKICQRKGRTITRIPAAI
jgi:3D (Asp-Asp-Asp) domain-containing protein